MIASGIIVALWLTFNGRAEVAETDQGRQMYLQYCSSCHGKDGSGNGPVSSYLKVKPPNLTLLKKANNGIYPLNKVMSAIDGSRAVRAHGDREMPVWGEIFRKEAVSGKYPELTSVLEVKLIAEYVATLQK